MRAPNFTIEMVIHPGYGGFGGLDREMVDWLVEHRRWPVKAYDDYDYEKEKGTKLLLLDRHGERGAYCALDHDVLRVDPDFVACVKELHKLSSASLYERRFKSRRVVDRLQVVRVLIQVRGVDVHDGREEVRVDHSVESVLGYD